MTRAVLIDPFQLTLTEVDWDGSYSHAYKLMNCEIIQPMRDDDLTMLIDEEGLLKDKEKMRFFNYTTRPDIMFQGKALIIGPWVADNSKDGGHEEALTIPLNMLQSRIVWRNDIIFTGFRLRSGIANHPIFGDVSYVKQEPIFIRKKHKS